MAFVDNVLKDVLGAEYDLGHMATEVELAEESRKVAKELDAETASSDSPKVKRARFAEPEAPDATAPTPPKSKMPFTDKLLYHAKHDAKPSSMERSSILTSGGSSAWSSAWPTVTIARSGTRVIVMRSYEDGTPRERIVMENTAAEGFEPVRHGESLLYTREGDIAARMPYDMGKLHGVGLLKPQAGEARKVASMAMAEGGAGLPVARKMLAVANIDMALLDVIDRFKAPTINIVWQNGTVVEVQILGQRDMVIKRKTVTVHASFIARSASREALGPYKPIMNLPLTMPPPIEATPIGCIYNYGLGDWVVRKAETSVIDGLGLTLHGEGSMHMATSALPIGLIRFLVPLGIGSHLDLSATFHEGVLRSGVASVGSRNISFVFKDEPRRGLDAALHATCRIESATWEDRIESLVPDSIWASPPSGACVATYKPCKHNEGLEETPFVEYVELTETPADTEHVRAVFKLALGSAFSLKCSQIEVYGGHDAHDGHDGDAEPVLLETFYFRDRILGAASLGNVPLTQLAVDAASADPLPISFVDLKMEAVLNDNLMLVPKRISYNKVDNGIALVAEPQDVPMEWPLRFIVTRQTCDAEPVVLDKLRLEVTETGHATAVVEPKSGEGVEAVESGEAGAMQEEDAEPAVEPAVVVAGVAEKKTEAAINSEAQNVGSEPAADVVATLDSVLLAEIKRAYVLDGAATSVMSSSLVLEHLCDHARSRGFPCAPTRAAAVILELGVGKDRVLLDGKRTRVFTGMQSK